MKAIVLAFVLAGCRYHFDPREVVDDANVGDVDAPSTMLCTTSACDIGFTCVSGTCVQVGGTCITTIRYTVRDLNFMPVDRADGNAKCASYWPATHWCDRAETSNVDWYPHPLSRHAGNHPNGLGTRQLVFVADNIGCAGGFICSNNFENTNTALCNIPGCENTFCADEALLCCPD